MRHLYGRPARIAIGVAVIILILASWLSMDWLFATPRTTQVVAQVPDGKTDQDGQDGRTPGHPVGVGSSSTVGAASGRTGADGVSGGGDGGGPSSGGPGSYSSSVEPHGSIGLDSITALDGTRGESGGSTPGWSPAGGPGSGSGSNGPGSNRPGSSGTGSNGSGSNGPGSNGTGSNGSPAPLVAGLPPNADPTPHGNGPSGTPGSGPASDGGPLSVASDGGSAGLPGGLVPPPISTGGSSPPRNGQGPVTDTPPWGGPEPSPGPDATVPVPPGLLIFGAAASMLAVVSRMRRGSPRSREESPLTR